MEIPINRMGCISLYSVYIYVGYKPLTMDADASNDVEGWLMC